MAVIGQRLSKLFGSFSVLSTLGVFAATVIVVNANVLTARHYARWDVTSAGLYSLSRATTERLRALREPIDIVVFVSPSDPLFASVRQLLTAYGAETAFLRSRFVDPDRDPTQFLALQNEYGITPGRAVDGEIVSGAPLVVARGDRRWIVTADQLFDYASDEAVHPKLEQALTEAIARVVDEPSAPICFSTGHQELSGDDLGPHGLSELRERLKQTNFEVEVLDLSLAKLPVLSGACSVLVVAGPEIPFSATAAEAVAGYLMRGGRALVLANPGLGEQGRVAPTGLDPVLDVFDSAFNHDFVIETDEAFRLPGLGDVFLAEPRPHAVTRGLLADGDHLEFRVMLRSAQSLSAGRRASPLLQSSKRAFSVRDVRPFVENPAPETPSDAPSGPFVLAMAAELERRRPDSSRPRLVVVGSDNLAQNENFTDPTLLGNRLFVENALSWLAARPALVSIPEKPARPAGFALTDESLSRVQRYVLLYMPGTTAALAAFVLFRRRRYGWPKRRRSNEQTSKAGRERGAPETDG